MENKIQHVEMLNEQMTQVLDHIQYVVGDANDWVLLVAPRNRRNDEHRPDAPEGMCNTWYMSAHGLAHVSSKRPLCPM